MHSCGTISSLAEDGQSGCPQLRQAPSAMIQLCHMGHLKVGHPACTARWERTVVFCEDGDDHLRVALGAQGPALQQGLAKVHTPGHHKGLDVGKCQGLPLCLPFSHAAKRSFSTTAPTSHSAASH